MNGSASQETQAMNWTTLVSAEELSKYLSIHERDNSRDLSLIDARATPSLQLVDARFALNDSDAGERAWQLAHLPGAVYVHLDRDLSDHTKPASEGRHPLPNAETFCTTLMRLGIRNDSQIVVYDAGDGAMAAARFWWLMKLLGHTRVAVLDGGFARWTALNLPLEQDKPIITPGQYSGQFDQTRIANVEQVQQRLNESPGWLLDARAPERFRGDIEPLDCVAGHIPGALNRPFSSNLMNGCFRSPEQLRDEFSALIGERHPNTVVLSCGSGVTACHNALAMEHAGLCGARVYAGSWSGWISDSTRPTSNLKQAI